MHIPLQPGLSYSRSPPSSLFLLFLHYSQCSMETCIVTINLIPRVTRLNSPRSIGVGFWGRRLELDFGVFEVSVGYASPHLIPRLTGAVHDAWEQQRGGSRSVNRRGGPRTATAAGPGRGVLPPQSPPQSEWRHLGSVPTPAADRPRQTRGTTLLCCHHRPAAAPS